LLLPFAVYAPADWLRLIQAVFILYHVVALLKWASGIKIRFE
jgi:hypothetical protein